MLSAALVAGPLLLAALGHALVSTDQVRSDTLQTQIAQALQVQQDYQLQKAELVAPSRILAIAETHLHMITPHSVIYLPPVNPGKTVAQAHVPGSVTIPVHQAAGGAGTKDGSSSGSTTASHARP
jgi:type II secretory pathway pseudopilin PulG